MIKKICILGLIGFIGVQIIDVVKKFGIKVVGFLVYKNVDFLIK